MSNKKQNAAGRGCSSGFTRVGSGCRRHVTQTMLTGPTNNDNNTGDCYRVGGNCYTTNQVESRGSRRGAAQQQPVRSSVPVRNNPSVNVQRPPQTQNRSPKNQKNQPIKRRSEIEVLDYVESEELVSDQSKVDYIDCIDCDYSQYGNSNSYQGSQLAYQNPSYEAYEYEVQTEPPTLPPTLPPTEPPTQKPVQARRTPRRRQRQRVSSWAEFNYSAV